MTKYHQQSAVMGILGATFHRKLLRELMVLYQPLTEAGRRPQLTRVSQESSLTRYLLGRTCGEKYAEDAIERLLGIEERKTVPFVKPADPILRVVSQMFRAVVLDQVARHWYSNVGVQLVVLNALDFCKLSATS